MSRASQRNAWLIQHCFSPYGTTQLEKTGKKGFVWAPKGPFWGLLMSSVSPGGADLVPTTPDWPAWVGFMVTTHFDLVSGPSHSPNFIGLHSVSTSANMYHLDLRAGKLPRSASSHFDTLL